LDCEEGATVNASAAAGGGAWELGREGGEKPVGLKPGEKLTYGKLKSPTAAAADVVTHGSPPPPPPAAACSHRGSNSMKSDNNTASSSKDFTSPEDEFENPTGDHC
jgi:hypothetical protein